MHKLLLSLSALILAASPAFAKPPREESPAPRDLVQSPVSTAADDGIAAEIAAADAYPLGSLQNPIRVAGPDGELAYLHQLRCADGSQPAIGEKTEGGIGAYGSVTDAVSVRCRGASDARLVIDIYHEEHVETRSPAGFIMAR